MKTKTITRMAMALAVIVIFASCSTSRSYPDNRSYPHRYPRERVIIIRDQPRVHVPYRKVYRRQPVYAPPRRSYEYRRPPQKRYEYRRAPQRRTEYRKAPPVRNEHSSPRKAPVRSGRPSRG